MSDFPTAGLTFLIGMVVLSALTWLLGLGPYFHTHLSMLALAAYGCWMVGVVLWGLVHRLRR